MSRSLSSAELSSWALCPGSNSTLAYGANDCGAMDPRDKPWDDSVGVGASNASSGLGWIPAFPARGVPSGRAGMTVVAGEVAR